MQKQRIWDSFVIQRGTIWITSKEQNAHMISPNNIINVYLIISDLANDFGLKSSLHLRHCLWMGILTIFRAKGWTKLLKWSSQNEWKHFTHWSETGLSQSMQLIFFTLIIQFWLKILEIFKQITVLCKSI